MGHTHDIQDGDVHFMIDPITRKITTESSKTVLMKNDHNSERFTFEIPRYIEGHDMSLCDIVQIHYLNIEQAKSNTQTGIYEVSDLEVSSNEDDKVTFSWLISNNATRYTGMLNFTIHFACSVDSVIEYSWDTEIYSNIVVNPTIHNTEAILSKYADILEKWRIELFKINGEGLNSIEEAAKEIIGNMKDTGDAIIEEMRKNGDATTAKSWAVGGTGTRVGEDTDNSWYWARQAAKSAEEAAGSAESVGNVEVKDTHNISELGRDTKMPLQKFLDFVGTWLTTKVVTYIQFPTEFAKKLKNNGTTTEEGFALDARYGATMKTAIERMQKTVTVTLTAADWTGSAAPYTQTVSVSGITSKDDPLLVSLLDETANPTQQAAYIKAYAIVASGSGVTGDGSVTFKVYKKPATDITVGLTNLRGDV